MSDDIFYAGQLVTIAKFFENTASFEAALDASAIRVPLESLRAVAAGDVRAPLLLRLRPDIVATDATVAAEAMLASQKRVELAVHRLVELLGFEGVRRRVLEVRGPGEHFTFIELRVDGEAVWRADWEKTDEYVFEQRVRWLADPERFA